MMTNVTQNSLAQLRDIHLPPAISAWPLAPGWYLLIIALALILSVIIIFAFRYYKKRKKRLYMLRQLQQICVTHQDNPILAISNISALLRRITLARYPREKVAGLNGEAWLKLLDHCGNTHAFSQGAGRLLITAPYQQRASIDIEGIQQLIRGWINHVYDR